ncbi:MAG: hypothetical protein K0S86_5034, partial [Geminicoccaceae bacterium]|nr:hypothetical protein [Geminicoccaceae bacterium]
HAPILREILGSVPGVGIVPAGEVLR